MSYIHIFTDGLDKLLSVSIWYKWYGGNDALCFYSENELHGYILDAEYTRLSTEGKMLLKKKQFVPQLSATFQQLTTEVAESISHVRSELNQHEHLVISADLLERCYKSYFFTEEYYTGGLTVDSDMELINAIGKLRFTFIDTCIQATENVYQIASSLANKHDVTFYTINELLGGKNAVDVRDRKNNFLLIQKNQKLELIEGSLAAQTFNALVDDKIERNHVLKGMGASMGKVSGVVYLLNISSPNLIQDIENMPKDSILVTETTQPQLIMACKKAKAIITNEGGILSHAAIISRELGIPCVVGTRVATRLLHNGQFVEVNGAEGQVKLIEL